MYTFKLEQAIQAAAVLHQDHLRKGAVQIPYITHLVAVLMILRDYTNDEDTLVAALLHDTLEDTDYTEAEMKDDFGEQVTIIVKTLTEPMYDGEEKLTWKETKQRYAKQVKSGPLAAVLIAAADKAHNFRSVVEEYHEDPNRFMQDFGTKLEERLDAYQLIANSINSRLKDGIVHEFNHTFEAYKQFILDVQTSKEIN
jgi:(p)ppGpp synthase/HD superfamily hydrolase